MARTHERKAARRQIDMRKKQLEQKLDALPHLSVAQKAFLRERPHAPARPDILAWAHNYAQHNGVPLDSPGYFYLMDQALQQYGNIAFTTPSTASPATEIQAPSPQPNPEPTPAPMPQATQPPAPERDDDYARTLPVRPPRALSTPVQCQRKSVGASR